MLYFYFQMMSQILTEGWSPHSYFTSMVHTLSILFSLAAVAHGMGVDERGELRSELLCQGECVGSGAFNGVENKDGHLTPKSFERFPTGEVSPRGWLLDQLILQANSLSGYLSKSTFPGADHINTSIWVEPNGTMKEGTDQCKFFVKFLLCKYYIPDVKYI